jgi:hypothetical protein
MIEQLAPVYRFVCDRCGKEQFFNGENYTPGYIIKFSNGIRIVKNGRVCSDCYLDFCELAENFFDEVNKNG